MKIFYFTQLEKKLIKVEHFQKLQVQKQNILRMITQDIYIQLLKPTN